jgi:hypothetical protein
MVCHVFVLNPKVPFHVRVIAPQAPAHDLACVDVGAPTAAMGHWAWRFIHSRLRQRLRVRPCFGFVFGTGTNLKWTTAMVVPLHRQATYAFAVFAGAFPFVAHYVAKVFVHFDLIP